MLDSLLSSLLVGLGGGLLAFLGSLVLGLLQSQRTEKLSTELEELRTSLTLSAEVNRRVAAEKVSLLLEFEQHLAAWRETEFNPLGDGIKFVCKEHIHEWQEEIQACLDRLQPLVSNVCNTSMRHAFTSYMDNSKNDASTLRKQRQQIIEAIRMEFGITVYAS